MPQVFIYLLICSIAIFIGTTGLFFYLYRKYKSSQKLTQDYEEIIPSGSSYEYIDKNTLSKYRGRFTRSTGLPKADLKCVYLVHGTFVGEDPWHFIELLSSVLPIQAEQFLMKLKTTTKQGQDLFTKDNGNFTSKHIEILDKILDKDITVKQFSWSSGNHHYARIKGMIDLIKTLVISHQAGDRILLIGHSHGAQIFALLTKFITSSVFQGLILKHFSHEMSKAELKTSLKKIKSLFFDIVTLGAPPRYEWELTPKMKLIHFINHRDAHTVLGGHYSGVPFTQGGDYIQQWGIEGSDFMSPVEKQRKINSELDIFLGKGMDRSIFKSRVVHKKRLHNKGHHFLVDYGDNGKLPNFLLTIFGHGIYTKLDLLKFHFVFIFDHFYSKKPAIGAKD